MKKILIVCIGNIGNETEAIRQTLEYFGALVLVKYVGRPQDFIDVLQGQLPFDADSILISCHGEAGRIIMPELGEEVYTSSEPRGSFGATELEKYCCLKDKLIVNTGCTTGEEALAEVFSHANTYIAPGDYVEGNSALMFVQRFYYEMVQNEKSVEEAFEIAKAMDTETDLFRMK